MLAEGAVGKGLGSRALLATLKGAAVMHDASYWCPLQLRGRLPSLLAALRSVRFAPCRRRAQCQYMPSILQAKR